MNYLEFLKTKIEIAPESGFKLKPEKINKALKPHQRDAVLWALKGGRRALFESFGLGKTVQELEFCKQAAEQEGGKALIVLPLGVKQEFTKDSVNTLHYPKPEYCRTMDEVKAFTGQASKIYDYEEHVKLAENLDKDGKLPATFMVVAPGSWNNLDVWDDINRMRTLNTTQTRRRQQMHVCPLQLDIVERIINRYSNEGDWVLDPFGGLMTVPMSAVKMNRNGYGIELNPDYFRDGVGYLKEIEEEKETPTLFDFIEE